MTALQRSPLRLVLMAFAVLALSARLIIPSGFMPQRAGGHVVMAVCTSSGPSMTVIQVPGASANQEDRSESVRPASSCSVSATNAVARSAVDPLLLGAALAFILRISVFWADRGEGLMPPRLRPPLRGPPLTN